MSQTERAYRYAEGRCIDALLALRRLDGTEAVVDMKAAIRAIEEAQAQAKREHRIRWDRVEPAPPCPPGDF